MTCPRTLVAMMALSCSLTASACSSTTGGAQPARAAASSADGTSAALKFARCMREHGVQMEDPGPDGQMQIPLKGADGQSSTQAQKACEQVLGSAPMGGGGAPNPADQKRLMEQALSFAKCMRSKGIKMPDPSIDSSGMVRINPPANPDDPQTDAAAHQCEYLLGVAGKK